MKVVRRPLTADAVRFKNAEVFARTQGLKMDLETGVSYRWPQEADWPPEPVILTREGVRNINDGDWIITYVNGETDVMRPGQFAATFEIPPVVPPAGRVHIVRPARRRLTVEHHVRAKAKVRRR